MRLLNQAYAVLREPAKKARFDAERETTERSRVRATASQTRPGTRSTTRPATPPTTVEPSLPRGAALIFMIIAGGVVGLAIIAFSVSSPPARPLPANLAPAVTSRPTLEEPVPRLESRLLTAVLDARNNWGGPGGPVRERASAWWTTNLQTLPVGTGAELSPIRARAGHVLLLPDLVTESNGTFVLFEPGFKPVSTASRGSDYVVNFDWLSPTRGRHAMISGVFSDTAGTAATPPSANDESFVGLEVNGDPARAVHSVNGEESWRLTWYDRQAAARMTFMLTGDLRNLGGFALPKGAQLPAPRLSADNRAIADAMTALVAGFVCVG